MPNRILKESVCTSPEIDGLDPFEETFFYRLIVNCDDFGLMDARPLILKARLFPLKDIAPTLIESALLQCQHLGLVELYEVGGRRYVRMTGWEQHQRVRQVRSKYPHPAADGGELPRPAADGRNLRPESESESESNPELPSPSAAEIGFAEPAVLTGRGLTDQQQYLLRRLFEHDANWGSLTPKIVNGLSRKYGKAAVTSALRSLREAPPDRVEDPTALIVGVIVEGAA